MAFVIVWEFEAKVDCIAEFERTYGPDGAWARLFHRGDGYLGTELLCDREHPGRYTTIDRWVSQDAFDAHHAHFHAAYDALDRQCEALTVSEQRVGWYDTVG